MRYEIDIRGLCASLDTDTGDISGAGAGRLHALIDSVRTDGYVIGPPFPTTYRVSDPARNPAELAAVLVSSELPLPAGLDWSPSITSIPDDAVA